MLLSFASMSWVAIQFLFVYLYRCRFNFLNFLLPTCVDDWTHRSFLMLPIYSLLLSYICAFSVLPQGLTYFYMIFLEIAFTGIFNEMECVIFKIFFKKLLIQTCF